MFGHNVIEDVGKINKNKISIKNKIPKKYISTYLTIFCEVSNVRMLEKNLEYKDEA